jgi:HEAT repeat protein
MATLESMLASDNQSVRLKAALAAGTYPRLDFIEVLLSQCRHEPDFFVRDTLSWALMRQEREAVMRGLIPELTSPIAQARSQAVHTLSKIGDKENYSLISLSLLLDPEDSVASTAWRAASVLVPDDQKDALVKVLITQLGRGDSDTQFALTRFLCAIGDEILEPLKEAAKSANEEIRVQAEFTVMRYQEMKLESLKKSTVGGEGFEPPTSSV